MQRLIGLFAALALAGAPAAASAQMMLLGVGAPGSTGGGGGGGGGSTATFVDWTSGHPSNGTSVDVAMPALCASGDLLIVWADTFAVSNSFTATGSGAAFTPLDIGYAATGALAGSIAYRVLNSADVANGNITMTEGNNTYAMVCYRGATMATFQAHASDAGTSPAPSIAGFTPSGSSRGVVFASLEHVDGITPLALSGSPGTWAARLASRPWATVAYENDELAGYPGLMTTWSNYNTSLSGKILWLIELT